MYKIKPKRTLSIFGFTLAMIALAVIGFGIGYACTKFMGQSQNTELITPVQSQSPQLSSSEETKAAFRTSVEAPPKATPLKDEYRYLIRYEEGTTKVYDISEGKKILSHTLPIEVASLRQDDLTMLRNGVFLRTKDELLSFTEDFCS